MTSLSTRFMGLVNRSMLTEMLAHTYAEAKNIDPNEAYSRLEVALRRLELIEGIQRAIWAALVEAKPKLSGSELIALLERKLVPGKRYRALKPKRKEQGALSALMVLIDMGASVSTGEAAGLLGSELGEKLLREGFGLAGVHLASEMLR